MALTASILLEAGTLGTTFMLLLEVSTIKQSLRESDAIEVKTPALINMIKGWTA